MDKQSHPDALYNRAVKISVILRPAAAAHFSGAVPSSDDGFLNFWGFL